MATLATSGRGGAELGKRAAPRRLEETEAQACLRGLRTSPRKLNLVAQTIRGKTASSALAELTFSHRRISRDVKKVLQAAIANAENNHQLDVDRLYVKEATVGRAFVLKRFHTRGRGRSARIEKLFAHLTVIVRERAEESA
jgi:large subunit ribosomal protein L22